MTASRPGRLPKSSALHRVDLPAGHTVLSRGNRRMREGVTNQSQVISASAPGGPGIEQAPGRAASTRAGIYESASSGCRPGRVFWYTSQRISIGQFSRSTSNTSWPLTHSAYQLVGGHAPSGRCAFSYSYTESSATSSRGQSGCGSGHLVLREDAGVHLLPEFTRGSVGGVAVARQEGVEHQASTGGQALGGEFEQAAQLLRRAEIRHHLGEHESADSPAADRPSSRRRHAG